MKAAVVCPGPSALKFPGRGNYSVLIGVNRAPHFIRDRVDWWTFTDPRIYQTYPLYYAPMIWTSDEARRALAMPVGRVSTYESAVQFDPSTKWQVYSSTAAIVCAAYVGASEVEVFGCDWSGTSDADGHEYGFTGEPASKTRNAARWAGEREIWQGVADYLATKQVKVNRIHGNR